MSEGPTTSPEGWPAVEPTNWEHYVEPADGTTPTMSVTFAADYALDHASRPVGYDRCVVAELDLAGGDCHASGMPSHEALTEVSEVEATLVRRLAVDGLRAMLVGTLTGGRTRRLVFQVMADQLGVFVATTSDVLSTCAFPSRLAEAAHGWELYERAIVPDEDRRRQIRERYLIQRLVDGGAIAGQCWPLHHTFRGREDRLDDLVNALAGEGYRVVEWKDDRLILACDTPLELMEVWGRSTGLASLAASINVAYDGWHAPAPTASKTQDEAVA